MNYLGRLHGYYGQSADEDMHIDVMIGGITASGVIEGNEFGWRGEHPAAPDGCAIDFEGGSDGVTVRLPGRICRHEDGPNHQQWGIALEIDPTSLSDSAYAQFRSYVIDRTREALVCA